MRKSIVLALIFAVFLTACAPTGWNGVSTPLEITARVGTVIAETVEPPGTENPFPMPGPPTVIPTLPSSRLSPTELWASPRHPAADGRIMGELDVGDLLDGARVTFIERVPYGGTAAYDILPPGGTGFHWANGMLMGSTLTNE